jgi:N-acetylglucosamine-6-phosphate deacetylase
VAERSRLPDALDDDGSMTVRAGRVVVPGGVIEDGAVTVRGGRIEAITRAGPATVAAYHLPDAMLLPGVIDVHVHGSGGWRIGSDDDPDEALAGMSAALAKSGVTGFLATIATTSDAIALEALECVARSVTPHASPGATILGSHLEGPYLNPARKGAMRADLMRHPSIDDFEEFWRASQGTVRYLTLAPELPGARSLILALRERGVFVSAGHTDATSASMRDAFAGGVQGVTHLFNAMRGLHHREAGVVGAALATDEVWVELIGDGVHVHPEVMRLALALKAPDRVAIVSDTGRYAGMPSGTYDERHRTVIVDGVRCAYPDGTLAGSASPMHRNLMLLHREVGLSWPDVARLTATNPATMLGIDDRTGSLEVGKDADMIVIDASGTIRSTLVRGRTVYAQDEEQHAA